MMATRAANTGVKGKLAAWAFIMLRANSPRPRIKFSEICLIFAILTRLTIPVMDLRNASHVILWYSGLFLSCEAAACVARKRAGVHKHPQIILATCYRHSDFEIPTLVRDPRRALQFLRWCKHVQSRHSKIVAHSNDINAVTNEIGPRCVPFPCPLFPLELSELPKEMMCHLKEILLWLC